MRTPASASVPDHVPPELVRDIDPWALIGAAGLSGHARAAAFHEEFPPVFFATRLGFMPGCWVPRRDEELRAILQDTQTFSSAGLTGFSAMIGESWPLIPLEIDPPDHAAYRLLLNPLFTPGRVAALEADMRLLCRELISGVQAGGVFDFDAGFARRFPILIFLRLMGWPVSEAPRFTTWVRTLVKGQDLGEVAATARQICDYLRDQIARRRAAPSDDFVSYILSCRIEDRRLTDDEIIGVCFLIFIAGLDTVTSALAFQFAHLARRPEDQDRLRRRPDLVPEAVEELLRAYSIVNMRRLVTGDVEVAGARMKAGDFVLISTELANLDPEAFPAPTEVDFERENKRHMAFSYGPHRCLGSHLARRELAVALEEWLQGAPPFTLEDEDAITLRASGVFGLEGVLLRFGGAA